jgi:cytochrome o ubiquinol oxidase subunit 3
MPHIAAGRIDRTRFWLTITGLLGAAFVGIELYEFSHLIAEGATPQRSAFLPAFFTLVGTHGAHVTVGLIWMAKLLVQLGRHGLSPAMKRRLLCLSMFWHFLDIIWIGVFTFVYLFGVIR